jgi:hypothetical protein
MSHYLLLQQSQPGEYSPALQIKVFLLLRQFKRNSSLAIIKYNTMKPFPDFHQQMDSLSSKQLLTIVTQDRNEYQPEALEVAEKILQQRGVSYEVPQSDVSDINEEIKDRLTAGERPETVLLNLKERGISSLDFLPGIVKEENELHAEVKEKRKNKWAKIAGISLVIISVIRILIIWATRH